MSLLVDFLAVMCLIFQTTGETATVCFSRTCSLAWGLSEVDHWNATEFHKLLLYTSPVVLSGVSSQNVYQHFIPLFTAVTLLVSPIFLYVPIFCPTHCSHICYLLLVTYIQESLLEVCYKIGWMSTVQRSTTYVIFSIWIKHYTKSDSWAKLFWWN